MEIVSLTTEDERLEFKILKCEDGFIIKEINNELQEELTHDLSFKTLDDARYVIYLLIGTYEKGHSAGVNDMY